MIVYYYILTGLINAITSTILGLFVYFKNRKSATNKSFALFCLSMAAWSWAYIFWPEAPDKTTTFFWARALHIGAIFIPITYFCFTITLLNLYQEKKRILKFGYLLAFFFLIFSFSPFFIRDLVPKLSFKYWPEPGILYHFYLLMFFGYVFYSWYLVFRYSKKFTGIKKSQIRYLFWGTFIMFLGGSTNFLLFYNIPIPPIGNGLVFFYILFTALAILKYRLFEIKIILTELLVGVMGLILLSLPFLMPSFSLKVLAFFTFLLFCLFGYYLIKSVHEEAKRREEAEALVVRENVLREEAERLAKEREKVAEEFQIVAIQSMAFKQNAEEMAQRERKLREEAEKLVKVKTEFLILSTHHLRTPATGVKGIISLALDEKYGKISEKLRTALNKAYQSNEKAISIANQLIYASQIDLGECLPELKETDLVDLLNSLVKEYRIEAKKKNLDLIFEKPKTPFPNVFIDEKQIKEAFKNLLVNAIRYTQQGEIKVWFVKKPEVLLTIIKDSGVGIEKDALSVIFEGLAKGKAGYFYQMEGAGLNLYISRRLVEQNKGKIWAESDGKNKGSTFYVELPVI